MTHALELMAGAAWLLVAVLVPLVAGTLAWLLPQRAALWLALPASGLTTLVVTALTWQVVTRGPQRYHLGGWTAPLGIELHADGLATLMLLMTALVGLLISLYSVDYFADRGSGQPGMRHERDYFWPLWLLHWGSLNALFLSGDIFNLYITLEMVTLSAVALVALAGTQAALTGAMRYLVVALLSSLAYLLGVGFLYSLYGSLDLALLEERVAPGALPGAAVALLALALVMKAALFPLHFWLPPAHANAPAPISAVLSGLVVTAAFYVLLRLWYGVLAAAVSPWAGELFGVLGALAIVWGSLQALLAKRLKLLIAYSTVAQIGYLFLVFSLAADGDDSFSVWSACIFFAVGHAFAKASIFMAAGLLNRSIGHDRIDELDGFGQRLPMTFFTLGAAAVTLMGLPPSGTFIAKWLLIEAALRQGKGWLAGVIVLGGLLAAGYLFRVLWRAFIDSAAGSATAYPRSMDWTALVLALAALMLGLGAAPAFDLLRIGAPWPP